MQIENIADLQQLTSDWTQVSNRVNACTDDALKIVQDVAYELGLKRGVEMSAELMEIQSPHVFCDPDSLAEKIRKLAE